MLKRSNILGQPALPISLIMAIALVFFARVDFAWAGTHKGKCFKDSEKDFQSCTIDVSSESIQLIFDSDEKDPSAPLSISSQSVTAIDEAQDRRVSAATILVSGFLKKKVREFTLTYKTEGEEVRIASFSIKKKRATALRTDLVTATGVQVNQQR